MTRSIRPFLHSLVLPGVVIGSFGLLGVGLAASLVNGNLSAANAADVQAANTPYAPPTGLDVSAPVAKVGEVGGAGAIEPADRPVSLAPEVSGVVAEVKVAEGEQVTAGQPLLRLRDESALAEIASASADAQAAVSDLAAARADASAASARAELSASSATRTAALHLRGAATPDELDRAERTRDADAAAARASAARVEQANARLRSARAREELARARAQQLEVRAPIDGEVLQVLVRAGEAASPTSPVVVIGDTRRLRARIDINERDALAVQVGQRARVRIEGGTEDLSGTVVEVARRVGRKNVRTEDPTDRQDARFVETVVELDAAPRVPMGIRVQGFVAK